MATLFRVLALMLLTFSVRGQLSVTPSSRWTTQRWEANWIVPREIGTTYGVYHFRKTFQAKQSSSFVVHISADNRYKLFVNGVFVNEGPQLADVRHWKFESLNIAPYLKPGANVIAVQVTYFGEAAPVSMMGRRSGLIVQGDSKEESVINTDDTWRYVRNAALSPLIFNPGQEEVSGQYYAAGPLDRLDAGLYPWGWEQPGFPDQDWKTPAKVQTGAPFKSIGFGDELWELSPRNIPLLERIYEPLTILRRTNDTEVYQKFADKLPYSIPAGQKTVLLFDQEHLTTAFPEFVFSRGKGSQVRITYAEALFNDIQKKGNRDSIAGKSIHGVYDLFFPDGGDHRLFTTTSYRAFRYVQVEVTAGTEPLVVEKIGSWFTAYPFQKNASFGSTDPQLSKIFDVGWRTARLCAYETYMDCPYWERLQYIGDARIQALVSYSVSGDDRLARNAIEQFEWSLTYDGLTYSRYPSSLQQFIPNYSLVWILMVSDYFSYRNDPEFVKRMLPSVRRVLDHFQNYLTPDTLMTEQPYWDFLDHSFNTHKVVTESLFKKLTTNSLFYAYTLSNAASLFSYFNQPDLARRYAALSYRLKANVKKQCWDGNSELFADSPDKKHFSMHSNILAVLCGLMSREQQVDMLRRIVKNKGIVQTTLYFDFYLGRAMNQVGAGDLYFDLLDHWRTLLGRGLTTFPEGVSRSDCHAWSASPDFEMLASFAGIQPQGQGFKKVIVKPLLQKLDKIVCSMPHWAGKIDVILEKNGKQLKGSVVLPDGITGRLEWGSSKIDLVSGPNAIDIR
jgi:alpha-L-rhamnosidase